MGFTTSLKSKGRKLNSKRGVRRSMVLESLENRALRAGLVGMEEAPVEPPIGSDAPPLEYWDVRIESGGFRDSLLGPGGALERLGAAVDSGDQPDGATVDAILEDIIVFPSGIGAGGEDYVFFLPPANDEPGHDAVPCGEPDDASEPVLVTGAEVLAGGNSSIQWEKPEKEGGRTVFYRLGHLTNQELQAEIEYYETHLRNGIRLTTSELREIEYRKTELELEAYYRGDDYLGDLAEGRDHNISKTEPEQDIIDRVADQLPSCVVRNQSQVDRFTLDLGVYASPGFIGVSGGLLFAYDYESETWDVYGYLGAGAGTPGVGGHVYGGQGRNIDEASDLTGRSTAVSAEVSPPAAKGAGLGGSFSGKLSDPLNNPYIVEGGLSVGASPIPWGSGSVHEQYFWQLDD